MKNSTPTCQHKFGGSASPPRRAVGLERVPAAVPASDSQLEMAARPIHFEDLVERCMGNLDLATRLLDQSQAFLAEDLQLLRQCDEAADAGEVARLAHRLKGATANIGAYELSGVFARIEQHGGKASAAPDCLQEVETEWARFMECVADICSPQ